MCPSSWKKLNQIWSLVRSRRLMRSQPSLASPITVSTTPSPTIPPTLNQWVADRGPFSVEPWRILHDPNGLSYSTYCRARGRYEIALEFLKLHVESFERSVQRMKAPEDSAEDRRYARRSLVDMKADLKAFSKECPLLIDVRGRILGVVTGKHDGCDRKALESTVPHGGSTKFGVICIQLEKGSWVRIERPGKRMIIYEVHTPPMTNQQFLLLEISRPLHGPDAM
jgi:hypothetical protein